MKTENEMALSFLDSYGEIQAKEVYDMGGESVHQLILTFTRLLKCHF